MRQIIIILLIGLAGCTAPIKYDHKVPRTWELGVSYHQEFMNREYRQFWGESYENYGKENLRPRRDVLDPVTYDRFGNFLLPGYVGYRAEWRLDNRGATDWFYDGQRYINKEKDDN